LRRDGPAEVVDVNLRLRSVPGAGRSGTEGGCSRRRGGVGRSGGRLRGRGIVEFGAALLPPEQRHPALGLVSRGDEVEEIEMEMRRFVR
jgi:hypothetical protein